MTRGTDDLRDDVVDRAWRDAMRETPPLAIDDAIRAAARRAVGAKPRSEAAAEARGPWRWWMPLAAAAAIGTVAIGVIQSLPRDAIEPTVVSDASPARERPRTKPAEAHAGADAVKSGVATPEAAVQQERSMASVAPPRAAAPSAPAPAVTTDAAPRPARAPATAPATAPAAAPAAAPASTTAPAAAPASAPHPEPGPALTAKRPTATAGPESRTESPAASAHVAREQAGASGFAADPERRDAKVAAAPRASEGFVPSPPAIPPAVEASAAAKPGAPQAAPIAAAARDASARAKGEASVAQSASGPARGPAASASAEVQAMAVTPPDTFIAEIRRRLAAGDRDGAIRELQRFRRTHVDADRRLPDDLRAFAADVPR